MTCHIKTLPGDQLIQAAQHAADINPVNAPARANDFTVQRLAVLTSKYWGPAGKTLTVSFTEQQPAAFRDLVLQHMNAWYEKGANFRFTYTASGGTVRVTTQQNGYWSYLGTDVGMIPTNEPTMCLGGFTLNTSPQEFRRIVRHETGHTLGFPHEHLRKEIVGRIDPQKAYAYFAKPPNGWGKAMVDANVLTPLADSAITAGTVDETSVMAYALPGNIMRNGVAVNGGPDIAASDAAFAARIYPAPVTPTTPPTPVTTDADLIAWWKDCGPWAKKPSSAKVPAQACRDLATKKGLVT